MAQYTLSKAVTDILNARLQDEYNAERFYIAASIWCDLNGFEIASDYFVSEYKDERKHAHKLQKHATNWNVKLTLPSIIADDTFTSLPEIVSKAYEMEYALCEAYQKDIAAIDEEYPATEVFLQEFIKIQDEAVTGYADILKKLEGISSKFELLAIEKKVFK